MTSYVLLVASAFAAGAVNAIAGGGTLLTFPSLLMVLTPVTANATSTLALVPGSLGGAWGFRRDLKGGKKLLLWLMLPSLAGGIIGSLLLTRLDPKYFEGLIPYLILGAVTLFALQPRLTKVASNKSSFLVVFVAQLFVGIYGGYFGAGIGILMLTSLAYLGVTDIYEMNAMKNILAAVINGVSTIIFIAEGSIDWRFGPLMAVCAVAGGYFSARIARKVDRGVVRKLVIFVGYAMGFYYLAKQLS